MLLLDGDYQWLEESNYLWILDPGHGGLNTEGRYMTAPAKMKKFLSFTIYEGAINRNITNLVQIRLKELKIDYAIIAHSIEDTPLSLRVSRADAVYAKDKRAIYLSIHSNAGGGEGFEIFTSPGQSKSDKVAEVFCDTYKRWFPQFKFRKDLSDGDHDREADFYVLRKTDCPALLVENLFFDNLKEAEFLMSSTGQKSIADCIVQAILTCESTKPI